MDIYARWLVGGTAAISGGVTSAAWARWLDLNSFSFELDAEAIGQRAPGSVAFTLQYQSGMAELSRVLAKRSVSTVNVTATARIDSRELPLVECTFTGVLLKSFTTQAVSGLELPLFSGAFSYTKVDIKQTLYDLRTGNRLSSQAASIDITRGIFT